MGLAVREAFLGNLTEARREAEAALDLSKGRDVKYGAGLVWAMAADPKSQALAGELEKAFPEDTSVRYSYVPVLRALFAMKRGEPTKALEVLKTAAPYESGWEGSFIGAYGALYPIYV